jgi:methylated-DNA-[protein]-cysteine S-methyltransferase
VYTSYYPSPLGQLKLQSSGERLTAILFTEGEVPAGGDDHPILKACSLQLDEYFSGLRRNFDLPLGQQGTVFQQKVWDLLYAIPYGKTISYNDLAKQYGDLKAIRAVASANGRNNLSIIVPCHRIIGTNRSLTGYAGGLWRKKWLLDHEARYFSGVQTLGL